MFMGIVEIECDEHIDEIEWVLYDISKEQGRCLNDKDPEYYKTNPDKDLTIPASVNTSYTVTENENSFVAKGNRSSAHFIVVNTKDYGAFGKLSVSVRVRDSRFFATCEGWGNSYINIPYDMDDNKIADKWEFEKEVAGYPADWDEESIPDEDAVKGDGMTNYEEYRGFFIQAAEGGSIHKRFHPKVKELFVIDRALIVSTVAFDQVTGFKVYRLGYDNVYGELAGSGSQERKWVNFCRGFSQGTKYCLDVEKVLGLSDPYNDTHVRTFGYCTLERPKNVRHTVIFPDRIDKYLRDTKVELTEILAAHSSGESEIRIGDYSYSRGQIQTVINLLGNEAAFDYIKSYYLDHVVIHELCHGCFVPHHERGPGTGDFNCIMRYFYGFEIVNSFLEYIRELGVFGFRDDMTSDEVMRILAGTRYRLCADDMNYCGKYVNINDRLP